MKQIVILGVEIVRMPTAYEEVVGRVPIMMLEANWILRSFVDELRVNGFYLLTKRLLDLLGGAVGTLDYVIFLPIYCPPNFIRRWISNFLFSKASWKGRSGIRNLEIPNDAARRRSGWAAPLGARR